MDEPDLFDVENAALAIARTMHGNNKAGAEDYRRILGELIAHYERLMRETRRLIRRSDRAEREMNQLNRQLHDLAAQLEFRATHDPLTGALNRGAVIEHASRCLDQGDVALMVLDIDHFKQVNDDFGHPVGDAVIQNVVKCLIEVVGINGAIGRVGGEEFTVVWPNQSQEGAVLLAQRICDTIARQQHAATFKGLIGPGALVRRGSGEKVKECAIADFHQAMAWLREEAERGVSKQRYKGLGEMNPSQLWETTMDPTVRRL